MLKDYGAYKGTNLPSLSINAKRDVCHEKGVSDINDGKECPDYDGSKISIPLNTEAGLIAIKFIYDVTFGTKFDKA